jgi:hypothetical protein
VPLYLAGAWVGLWIAKVLLGWPLWIVAVVGDRRGGTAWPPNEEPEAPAEGTSATEEMTEEATEAAVPRRPMA